jgi:hypothetical protein
MPRDGGGTSLESLGAATAASGVTAPAAVERRGVGGATAGRRGLGRAGGGVEGVVADAASRPVQYDFA